VWFRITAQADAPVVWCGLKQLSQVYWWGVFNEGIRFSGIQSLTSTQQWIATINNQVLKGIETHVANSNIAQYERNGVSNMTRRLQSLTRKLCKINDKCHVAIWRQFYIRFSVMVNMSNPYWRSVFKPHGCFCKTGKLAKFVQTNSTSNWNQQYLHAIGWPFVAAKLQLRRRNQPSTFDHTVEGRGTSSLYILFIFVIYLCQEGNENRVKVLELWELD